MSAYRRVYVYLAAALSLQVLTWGAISLLRNLSRHPAFQAEAAAFQVAVIAVALPIFLAHWLSAQRHARRDPAERAADARRVYLFANLALFLLPILSNLQAGLRQALGGLLGATAASVRLDLEASPTEPWLAVALLALLALYHGRLLLAEGAWAATGGPPAAVRRAFLLGFSALGTWLTASAAVQLVVLASAARSADHAPLGVLAGALAGTTSRLVVALPAWFLAWTAAQRLHRAVRDERASVLRKVYLHGFSLVSVAVALGAAAVLLAGALRRALGLPVEGSPALPLALVAVGACGWLLHTLLLREDAALAPDQPRQAAVGRLQRYLVAGVALGAGLVGTAGLIQVIVRGRLEAGLGDPLRAQLAWSAALVAVAVLPWAATWARAQRVAALDGVGAAERTSNARRAYLYFYLLVATVVVLSGTVYLVFRSLTALLGTPLSAETPARVAEAVAYAVVGAGLWLLHAHAARADDRRCDAERQARARATRAVVLAPPDLAAGAAVERALADELPGLAVRRVWLPGHGQQPASEADAYAADTADALTGADLVIAPWPAPGAAAAMTALLDACGGQRLLLPVPEPGWSWVGVEPPQPEEAVRQVVHAVRRVMEGEPVTPARVWTPLHVLGAVFLALVVALTVVAPISAFVTGGGFLRFLMP